MLEDLGNMHKFSRALEELWIGLDSLIVPSGLLLIVSHPLPLPVPVSFFRVGVGKKLSN
jgi:hypothetical protein